MPGVRGRLGMGFAGRHHLYTAKGAGRDQVVPASEAHAEPPADARH